MPRTRVIVFLSEKSLKGGNVVDSIFLLPDTRTLVNTFLVSIL